VWPEIAHDVRALDDDQVLREQLMIDRASDARQNYTLPLPKLHTFRRVQNFPA
jgi:hypothetical protein